MIDIVLLVYYNDLEEWLKTRFVWAIHQVLFEQTSVGSHLKLTNQVQIAYILCLLRHESFMLKFKILVNYGTNGGIKSNGTEILVLVPLDL